MASKKAVQEHADATLEGLREIGSGWHISVAAAIGRGDHKALGMDRKQFAAEAGGFKLTDAREAIIELHRKKLSQQAIADVLGVSPDRTVARVLFEEGLIQQAPKKALERGGRKHRERSSGAGADVDEDTGGAGADADALRAQIEEMESVIEHEQAKRKSKEEELREEKKRVGEVLRDEMRRLREEQEALLTDTDRERRRKEAEAFAEEHGRKAMAGMNNLIASHVAMALQEAREDMEKMIDTGEITGDQIREIEAASVAFIEELNVAKAMADSTASEEVR